jgi:hypothetical protein
MIVVMVVMTALVPKTMKSFGPAPSREVTLYGRPCIVLAYDNPSPATGDKPGIVYTSIPALMIDVALLGALVAVMLVLHRRKAGVIVHLVAIGAAIGVYAFASGWLHWRSFKTMRAARAIEFAIAATVEITDYTADEKTLSAALSLAKPTPQGTSLNGNFQTGIAADVIVAIDGGWLAYEQECSKRDRSTGDVFVAKGSDGRWYYSTAHFCIDMLMAEMSAPYDDLPQFVDDKMFEVHAFDTADALIAYARANPPRR